MDINELLENQIRKIGVECLYCKESDHTGVWDGKIWQVCAVCGDFGILDEMSLKVLDFLEKD